MLTKTTKFKMTLGLMAIVGWISPSYGAAINTGNLQNTTTAGDPLVSNINATPTGVIRFEVGGAKMTDSAGDLTISISVDASTPSVSTGTAADQAFKDDTAGAAYFGYYLSTGVRSSNQTPASVNIKIKKGAGETANRSYYLVGNGVTTPTVQGDLTIAPAAATTFATAASNGVHCGPSYAANGLSAALACGGGATVANMDVTQFVKVLYSDPDSAAIVSQIEFTAVAE